MRIVISILLMMVSSAVFCQSPEHGTVRRNTGQDVEVWNEVSKNWIDVEAFWLQYAKQRGGLTWGRTKTYPTYSKVKEFDTLLIEVPQGLCLMEFFHSRWRRANDVRRWDEAFNEYGGCPYVFD